jgi:hypothetical protein
MAFGEQQIFGPWTVTATDDGAGNFMNCTAYGVSGDDQLILSYFVDEVWTVGVYRGAWNLNTNETYYLWYNVDGAAEGGGVIKRPVEAQEATRVFFEVSELEDIIARIEAGSQMNLQLRGFSMEPENLSFPLDQAPAAFAAARQCVADHSGGVAATTEEAKGDTGEADGETSADSPAEEPAPAEVSSPEGDADAI